jgi:hypothetical protein
MPGLERDRKLGRDILGMKFVRLKDFDCCEGIGTARFCVTSTGLKVMSRGLMGSKVDGC